MSSPTPAQIRRAMRTLHREGIDVTYREAWTLIRKLRRASDRPGFDLAALMQPTHIDGAKHSRQKHS